ncbi:MAG: hypothetical protein R2991_10650 [Thermoanaerobaculia bacterium]
MDLLVADANRRLARTAHQLALTPAAVEHVARAGSTPSTAPGP